MPLPPTYTNFVAPAIQASNLNEINLVIYQLMGNGVDAPINDSEVRTNLGLGTMATQNTPLTVANGGVSNAPVFSAYRNSTQAIPDGALTEVVLNVEEFDTNNNFDATTGRFTPTVAGYYQINCSATISVALGFTTNYQVHIYKNGVSYKRGLLLNTGSNDNLVLGGGVSSIVFLNGTTDFVSMYVFSDLTAGTQAIQGSASANETWMNGHFVRA